jgi:hypothetical protein
MLLVDIVLRRSADGPRVIRLGDEFPCCMETVNTLEGLTQTQEPAGLLLMFIK